MLNKTRSDIVQGQSLFRREQDQESARCDNIKQYLFNVYSMYIQCLAIYPMFSLLVVTDRHSYPNCSSDAIASKNKTKRLIDVITSYFGLVITPSLPPSLPYSHTPNLEVLSHLRMLQST